VADVKGYIQDAVEQHRRAVDAVADMTEVIGAAVDIVATALRAGGSVLFCGNGGSAADAQHLAAELVGRFEKERPGWAAHALHANTSSLTAIGNDYGFDRVFARQVEAFGRSGDVLVALSTSGGSPNVLAAIETARSRGMKVIGMTGGDGGKMATVCDVHLNVGVGSTARVQEAHIMIGHIVCGLVEESLCERP
jgi:D-sedoheptulose 7-phosphate isomerase